MVYRFTAAFLALFLCVFAPPLRAEEAFVAPFIEEPPEPRDLNFNLGFRDGEQRDSLLRSIKNLYYNLEGKGAIRDGIRFQEDAIIRQQAGKADPAQSALHAVTLDADAAVVEMYRKLRGHVLLMREFWSKRGGEEGPSLLDVRASLEETAAGFEKLEPKVRLAAQWHAVSHRAVGGDKTRNPTGMALLNASASAAKAVRLAEEGLGDIERSLRGRGDFPPEVRKLLEEPLGLPELHGFGTRLQLAEIPDGGPGVPPEAPRFKPMRRITAAALFSGM